MAVVLPQGALFRRGAEARIRQAVLEEDLVEIVVGLAPNIFYGTGLAPAIVALRRNKPPERRHRVLLIDATDLFRKGQAQNFLDPDHASQILEWSVKFEDVEDRARIVNLKEIEDEGWTLNISRYVQLREREDVPDLPEAVSNFKRAVEECRDAEDRLRDLLIAGSWLA